MSNQIKAAIIIGGCAIIAAALAIWKPEKEIKSSIAIFENITGEKMDSIDSVDRRNAPFHIYVKGVATNSINYYVYLVVNDNYAEWIEPINGLGAHVDNKFIGECFLGKKDEVASLNKLYTIYAVVVNREYMAFNILDRKTIISQSNIIELYRTH